MDVIRHYNERIRLDCWKPFRKPIPHCLHYPTRIAHANLPIYHIAKQTLSVPSAYRHEIGTLFGIIESPKAEGSAAGSRGDFRRNLEGRSKQRPYRLDQLLDSTDGERLEHFS